MAPRSLRSLTIGKPTTAQPGPPSPTFSDATRASGIDFGLNGPEKIITRADLKSSMNCYETLMSASAGYRAALMHLSRATATFADALENVSGLKGPSYECGTRLQASSGLHHLISNHWHVLSNTLEVNFERPLQQHLETYKTILNERSASYEKALRDKSQIIRQTEARSMNKKERNLQSFRESLNVLQRQVDDLDDLKAAHYTEILEHEEEVWDVVQAKTCVVVRSTMDVFERFTAKSSDPTIEAMLQSVPDPFDAYVPQGETNQGEDQIFSILQPLAIISNAPSPSPSPLMTPVSDAEGRTAVWTPHSSGFFPESEWGDVPSPSRTPPRSVSPPARRNSHPGHQSRKSESKLRSVLAVIDESHSRQASHEDNEREEHTTNGNGRPQEASWNSSSSVTSLSGEATPRNSMLFSSSPPPGLPDNPDLEGTRSPDSDHTVSTASPPVAA